MSLINNMLRDLDQRRATLPTGHALEVRPTKNVTAHYGQKGWRWGFVTLALLVLASVAYGINATQVTPTVEPPTPPLPRQSPPFTLTSLRFSGGSETPPPLPEALSLQESRQLTVEQPDQTPLAAMSEVGELVRSGQHLQAEKRLRQSLRRDPMDQHSRLLLARLLWDRQQQEKAIALLKTALPHSQGSDMARLLAHFRLQQQRPEEALVILEQAASRLGWEHGLQVAQDLELASFMAAIHQQLGEHRQAIEWYNALLHNNPQESNHWLAMAISLEAITARAEAKQAYRRALDTGRLTPTLQEYAEGRLATLIR